MINYNLERVFKARGIDRPYSYLVANGIVGSQAANLIKGKLTGIRASTIERLCLILYCTPNDIMEWVPDMKRPVDSGHPLHKLKRSGKDLDLTSVLHSLPLESLEKVEQLITEERMSAEVRQEGN